VLYFCYRIYDRILKESSLCLEKDSAVLRKKNEQLLKEMSGKDEALFTVANEKSTEIIDLRSDLKVKAFELATLRVALEVDY
jgi:hypothetical protein